MQRDLRGLKAQFLVLYFVYLCLSRFTYYVFLSFIYYLVSSADTGLGGMTENSVKIFNDGNMSLHFPSIVTSLCTIDITHFPFDTQSCSLQFGSWAYNGNDLDCRKEADEMDLSAFVRSIEWDIVSAPIQYNETYYTTETGEYIKFPSVTFTVNLRRKPLFYILNIISPCLLITFVAVFGFLLPPESGEKVNLSVTVLLSLAVFQLLVLETMPASGETVPLIGELFVIASESISSAEYRNFQKGGGRKFFNFNIYMSDIL